MRATGQEGGARVDGPVDGMEATPPPSPRPSWCPGGYLGRHQQTGMNRSERPNSRWVAWEKRNSDRQVWEGTPHTTQDIPSTPIAGESLAAGTAMHATCRDKIQTSETPPRSSIQTRPVPPPDENLPPLFSP